MAPPMCADQNTISRPSGRTSRDGFAWSSSWKFAFRVVITLTPVSWS
jgi:hypothetical protein